MLPPDRATANQNSSSHKSDCFYSFFSFSDSSISSRVSSVVLVKYMVEFSLFLSFIIPLFVFEEFGWLKCKDTCLRKSLPLE